MTRAVENVIMMQYFRRLLEIKQIGLPLDKLLVRSSSFETTDLRDRIYGLLALSTKKARRGIHVDYDETIKERDVAIRATRFTLIKDSSFQLLESAGIGYIDFQERPAERPTWVPWWNSDNITNRERRRAILRSESYKTATHIQGRVVHGDDDDCLIRIQASNIDEIATMSPVWFPGVFNLPHTTSDEELIKHIPKFLDLVDAACEDAGLASAPESQGNWPNPMWRTLCHNSVETPEYFEECGVQIAHAASELREMI